MFALAAEARVEQEIILVKIDLCLVLPVCMWMMMRSGKKMDGQSRERRPRFIDFS